MKGASAALPEVQRLIFDGELVRAHKLFGRTLLGRPVEQQKYQSIGSLVLASSERGDVTGYRHALDLDTRHLGVDEKERDAGHIARRARRARGHDQHEQQCSRQARR